MPVSRPDVRNTTPGPNVPLSAPANAGTATCAKRLPVKRSDSADARIDGSTRMATQFMDNGWLMPQQKPTTAINTANHATLPVNAAAMMAGADTASAAVSNVGPDATRMSSGIPARDSMENTERSAIMNNVNTYISEMRLKFITGSAALDDATWAEYLATLENYGLSRAIEITQTA